MIQTERLLLEQAALEDKAFFFALLNSPNWIRYIGDRGIKTMKDVQEYIQNALLKSYQENGFGLLKMNLKSSGKPIGICGFLKRDYLTSVDIGFALLPEFEGKGYTYEAAKATLDYGKTHLGIETVFGITTGNNEISQHLLQKLGLRFIAKRVEKEELLVFSNQIDPAAASRTNI